MENEKYLKEQLITYIGNKRSLLSFINESVVDIKKRLGKEKLITFDGFAGSGVVSRFLKQHSSKVYANDLEKYSYAITKSFLTNVSDVDFKYINQFVEHLNKIKTQSNGVGIIEKLYAPKNTENILFGERCFYTNENAKIIDRIRQEIETEVSDEKYKNIFLSILLHKSSVHTNTSGVFKGFYKSSKTSIGKFGGDGENALTRILGEINMEPIILSNYECNYEVFNGDTNEVVKEIEQMDLVYYDPPYNQHPYGSNYHILNTIYEYVEPEKMSKVSGIREDWNKSEYNKKIQAETAMDSLIENTNSKYILISYNNEGIISSEKMVKILQKYGEVELKTQEYNTFKGSRNLKDRDNKVQEQIYILKKNK
jgi:adenine-specific DNA-methyltransferase